MKKLIACLAEARFLTRERAFLYGMSVAFVYVSVIASGYWLGWWFVDRQGRTLPVDFLAFWSAGFVPAQADMASIYDADFYKALQVRAIGHDFDLFFYWSYPPVLLLLARELAELPYYESWFLWVVATGGLMALGLRLLVPGRVAATLLMAAPASVWCALVGQNGFLTGGLMAFALGWLETRPGLAGACIGLLTYKPQFGLLMPFFLLVTRQWRVFAAATLTALLLAVLSGVMFGFDTWWAFAASLSHSGDFLLSGGAAWSKLQSLYAIAYQIVPERGVALAVHVGCGFLLLAGLVWLWTTSAAMAVKAAALVAASFLITPYAYIYDAVFLTTGVALLVGDGIGRGFLPWEKLCLVLALAMPALFLAMGSLAAPLEAVMILAISCRRAALGARGVSAVAAAFPVAYEPLPQQSTESIRDNRPA